MIRGYVDTPVGKLVIANLAAAVIAQYRPGDAKLAKLGNAMMQNAYMELMRSVNIEGMIDEFLSKPEVQAATAVFTDVEKQT